MSADSGSVEWWAHELSLRNGSNEGMARFIVETLAERGAPASSRLRAWEIDRLFELRREWSASVVEYERTTIEGVEMLRVTLTIPDPKQEEDGHYAFLVSPGATVALGPKR